MSEQFEVVLGGSRRMWDGKEVVEMIGNVDKKVLGTFQTNNTNLFVEETQHPEIAPYGYGFHDKMEVEE